MCISKYKLIYRIQKNIHFELSVFTVLCVCFCKYLDHGMKRTGKHPSECSSDVQHVHLTAADHHSDQGVVISSCTLHRGDFTHSMNNKPKIAAAKILTAAHNQSPSLRSTGSQQNKLAHSWHTSLQNGKKVNDINVVIN